MPPYPVPPAGGPLVALTHSAGTGPLNDSARHVGQAPPPPMPEREPVHPEMVMMLDRPTPWPKAVLARLARAMRRARA